MTSTPLTPVRVADSGHSLAGIDNAGSSERAVPYFCPYCADEDLRPLGSSAGEWHCRTCLRSFALRFLGLAPTTTTGGSR